MNVKQLRPIEMIALAECLQLDVDPTRVEMVKHALEEFFHPDPEPRNPELDQYHISAVIEADMTELRAMGDRLELITPLPTEKSKLQQSILDRLGVDHLIKI